MQPTKIKCRTCGAEFGTDCTEEYQSRLFASCPSCGFVFAVATDPDGSPGHSGGDSASAAIPPKARRSSTDRKSPRHSNLPVLLAMMAAFAFFLLIAIMSQGFGIFVGVVGLVVFGLIGFHYVVWGWWLGAAIRKKYESEDSD